MGKRWDVGTLRLLKAEGCEASKKDSRRAPIVRAKHSQHGYPPWEPFGGVGCLSRRVEICVLVSSAFAFPGFIDSLFRALMAMPHPPAHTQSVRQDLEDNSASTHSRSIPGPLQTLNSSLSRIRLHENQRPPTTSRSDSFDDEWVSNLLPRLQPLPEGLLTNRLMPTALFA